MSEDIQNGPKGPEQEPAAPESDYGTEWDIRLAPRYPPTVIAAGTLWVVWGCLIAAAFLAPWLTRLVATANLRNASAPLLPLGLGLGGLIVWIGIRFIRGTEDVKDTSPIATVSLLGGFLALSCTFWEFSRAVDLLPRVLQLADYFAVGATGLSAGILFLCGRRGYQSWWNVEKARKEREKKHSDNPFRK